MCVGCGKYWTYTFNWMGSHRVVFCDFSEHLGFVLFCWLNTHELLIGMGNHHWGGETFCHILLHNLHLVCRVKKSHCLNKILPLTGHFSWWRHQMETFPRYWLFVRRIHRSQVNIPNKGQWRGALLFSLICAWINGWLRQVIWDAIALIMASQ